MMSIELDVPALLLAGIIATIKWNLGEDVQIICLPDGKHDFYLPIAGRLDAERVQLEKFSHVSGATIWLGYSSRRNALLYGESVKLGNP